MSSWSGETEADEGLEVSRQMIDSLLLGAGTQLENEEYLMGISSRLQMALEKMLMTITNTTNQVQPTLWPSEMANCLLPFTALISHSTNFWP